MEYLSGNGGTTGGEDKTLCPEHRPKLAQAVRIFILVSAQIRAIRGSGQLPLSGSNY
jgi:hypothetical protein